MKTKDQAQKDLETLKWLLAELRAGWRGGVMEGVWIDQPARYIEAIDRVISKLLEGAGETRSKVR